MKQPACVLWALTKKNNAQLVKFNHNQFSHAATNVTGFHNASQAASQVSVDAKRVGTKKQWRRVFVVQQAHSQHNGRKKVCKSGLVTSSIPCKEMKNARKAIGGMQHVNQKGKDMALRRLARQHAANRSSVPKGHVAK